MGICCSSPQPQDPHAVKFGQLLIKLCPMLPTHLDTIIIITNGSMQYDPFQSRFQSKQTKQKYIIERGIVKHGSVAQLNLNKQGVKDALYITFPQKDDALLDFKIHQSITKALEKAFEFDENAKVGIAVPPFAVLKLDGKLYETKLVNALKLFSIERKTGTINVEMLEKRIPSVMKGLKAKIFDKDECDEE